MSKKILIVDDDTSVLETLTDLFEIHGYNVIMVEDGNKAIELVEKKLFDIILLDIQMPKIDGITTLKWIKEVSPLTAVIMMTAGAPEKAINEAKDIGVLGLVQKPFKIDEVVKLIDENEKKKWTRQPSILIVEDDETFCDYLRTLFETEGYKVKEATTAKETLEKIRKEIFDLVVIDQRLPDSKGTELAVKIKEFYPEMDIIIIITAYADLDTAIESIRIKVCDFILKPIDADYLLKVVKDIIRKKPFVNR